MAAIDDYYAPAFLLFWKLTNQKGNKKDAQKAYFRRLETHSEDEIRAAHKQLKEDKQGQDHQYWPSISAFLNSKFDSYYDRACTKNDKATRKTWNFPEWKEKAASKLNKAPYDLPWHGRDLTTMEQKQLNIPAPNEAKKMLKDISLMMDGKLQMSVFYRKYDIPDEWQDKRWAKGKETPQEELPF